MVQSQPNLSPRKFEDKLAVAVLNKYRLEEVKKFVEIFETRIAVKPTRMPLRSSQSFFENFNLASSNYY